MNCGKKVRLKPMKVTTAASCEIFSGYMRPVILGHQKWMPARKAISMPPTMTKWKWATMK